MSEPLDLACVDLTQPITQAHFGQLVDISQAQVSEYVTKGVMTKGASGATWLREYTKHQREQAAGRGADGELAANRAKESASRNELLQIKLAERRREVAAVALIEQVLATVGARIASKLEPLPARIKTLCPEISAEALKLIEQEITEARNKAAAAGLAVLAEADPNADDVDDRGVVAL